MNKFIKLTEFNSDRAIYFNVSQITQIETTRNYEAKIYTTDGNWQTVNENIEEVMNLINN